MNSWFSTFSECIELETIEASLLDDLGGILSWFISTGLEDSYKRSLIDLYGEQEFIRRFEELVDRLIIADYAVGDMFPLCLNEGDAKKRYRQLIRIFHPDRGIKPERWLTYRAEKINKAYRSYQDAESDSRGGVYSDETSIVTQQAPPANNNKKKTRPKTKFTYQPNAWRSRLGSAKQFQRRVVLSLSLLSIFLVFIFYLSSQAPAPNDAVVIKGYEENKFVATSNGLSQDIEAFDNIEETENIGSTYILDSKAKEILDDADWLNRDSDDDIQDLLAGNTQQNDIHDSSSHSSSTQGKSLIRFSDLGNADRQSHDLNVQEVKGLASKLEAVKKSKPEIIQEKKNVIIRGSQDNQVRLSNPVCDLSVPDSAGIKQLYYVLRPANIFKGPSSDCPVISSLAEHEFVALVNERDDRRWRLIRKQDSDAVTGWVEIASLSRVSNQRKTEPVKRDDQLVLLNVKEQVNKTSENITDQSSSYLVAVIADMKHYYETGDGDGVAGLYLSSGRENKIRGDQAIRKYYRKAFSKTVKRQFNYEVDSVIEDNETTAIIEGRMYISLAAKSSPSNLNKINADFSIVLVKIADGYKIAAFDWVRQ